MFTLKYRGQTGQTFVTFTLTHPAFQHLGVLRLTTSVSTVRASPLRSGGNVRVHITELV